MAYQELKENLRGVAFTNPTHFTEDGTQVDHEALKAHVSWLADSGARLIVPCGNTGEYYSLSNEERIAVVETVADGVGDAVSIVGGIGGSTATATSLANAYEDAGADAVMIMHPVHTYLHEKGILNYYTEIVDTTDLGVVLYKRGPELTKEHISTLADRENVVGVKYAVNDVNSFSLAVDDIGDDVVWINGIAERFSLSFAIEGAEGFTTGIGNFVPKETLALMEAIREEDWDRATVLRNAFRPYEELREGTGEGNSLASANNVPAVKFGLELAGKYGGPVREPLVGLSEADANLAESYYDRIKDIEV